MLTLIIKYQVYLILYDFMLCNGKHHHEGVFQIVGPNPLVSYEINFFAIISILKNIIAQKIHNALYLVKLNIIF